MPVTISGSSSRWVFSEAKKKQEGGWGEEGEEEKRET